MTMTSETGGCMALPVKPDEKELVHMSNMSWIDRVWFINLYVYDRKHVCRERYGLDERDRRVHGIRHTQTT